MNAFFALVMGGDYQHLSMHAQYLLQSWSLVLHKFLHAVSPEWSSQIFFSRAIAPLELSPWLNVLAHIFALSLLFSAAWIVAYPLAILNCGLTVTYLGLRQRQDAGKSSFRENFLERPQADE